MLKVHQATVRLVLLADQAAVLVTTIQSPQVVVLELLVRAVMVVPPRIAVPVTTVAEAAVPLELAVLAQVVQQVPVVPALHHQSLAQALHALVVAVQDQALTMPMLVAQVVVAVAVRVARIAPQMELLEQQTPVVAVVVVMQVVLVAQAVLVL